MGESGSGNESTLLNMIATLDKKPTSGKSHLNGDDLTQIKEKAAAFRREPFGFLFSKILTYIRHEISVKR